MNSEYIQALIARIAAGQNKIEDFPEVIQEKIAEFINSILETKEVDEKPEISVPYLSIEERLTLTEEATDEIITALNQRNIL